MNYAFCAANILLSHGLPMDFIVLAVSTSANLTLPQRDISLEHSMPPRLFLIQLQVSYHALAARC